MPRSPWSVAGEALVTVVLLVGPPLLATRPEWPLGEDTTWVWLWQYLRGGTVPDEAVLAFLLVALWGIWGVHLVIVALDVVALARGLVPRVGLVRLVWVLMAGGATATTTHTTAVAAPADAVAEAPTTSGTATVEETPQARGEQAEDQDTIDRTRTLGGFGFDSADLTPAMAESLEPTIGLIADFGHPEVPVVVTGHTDPVGDPYYNQGLSERRAQAVADHLAGRLDADVEIEVHGVAATEPPSNPRASYGEYRRVEVSYTVQRPTPAPEPSVESESPSEAAPAPARAGSGATAESDEAMALDAVMVGAVSGVVGVGVGYAAGRRRAAAMPRKRGTGAEPTTGLDDPSDESVAEDAAPGQDGLLRQDVEGLARGVIDEDGYLLVSDALRVNSEGGVAFVGVHAARVLAAVVTGHAPGPVVATTTAAAALAAENTPLEGVQVVPALARVLVAVEAELLARARRLDEGGDDSVGPATPARPVLVALEASDLDTDQGLPEALTITPGVVVCVLGNSDDAETMVDCEDTRRVRVRTRGGEVTHDSALRRWSPPQGQEDQEGTTADEESPPASEHAAEVDRGQLNRLEEERPGTPPETEPPTGVRVRLFAPQVVCEVGGEDALSGVRTAARTLLSLLALHPRGVSNQELAEVLAPGTADDQAKKAVHNAVSRLRKPLRDALGTDEVIVSYDKGRYQIQEEFFDIDVREFMEVYSRIKGCRSENEVDDLRRLVGMYRSKLLSDVGGEWVEAYRSRLQVMFADSCVRLSRKVSNHEEKVDLLERSISIDVGNEALYQELMESYSSMGRMDSVYRVYSSLEEVLKGVQGKPSQRTRDLLKDLTCRTKDVPAKV